MLPQTTSYHKIENRLFFLWLAVVGGFFFWSRLDFSDHIYYFGDGNVIVELIRLILTTHDWDPNWVRLVDVIRPQAELMSFITIPEESDRFYHMSGYIVISAAICKIIYWLGFSEISIQSILHGQNVVMQLFILLLLFKLGQKLVNRYIGLLAVTLFVLFPLAIMEAHYERPESWMCLLVIVIMYSVLCFCESPKRHSLLIGISIGLSIATKLSQLFLGLIPAILLLHVWLDTTRGSLPQRSKQVCAYGALILAGMVAAIGINTPFILKHLTATIESVKLMASFYATPTYPYAEEQYNYFSQLYVSLRYFLFTLGGFWCFFILLGTIKTLSSYKNNSFQQRGFYLALIAPLIIFFFYSALQVNFVERNFSPMQGVICLIAAMGIFSILPFLKKNIPTKVACGVICSITALIMLYTPTTIDFNFVQRYIKHPDKPLRVAFQDALKNDFKGFWIKNNYFTLKITREMPQKPGKAPRLYQVDDLNEHWTKQYLVKLEQNSFKKAGTYCSEFSDLPPNTLTLYHAAAKNHYYVRLDEWPADLPQDYFKTNCN